MSSTAAATESVITLRVRLEIALREENDQWIAWCLPLDILTQDHTKKAAKASLRRAIKLWFESCIKRGVLEQALQECGFYKGKPGEVPPAGASVVQMHSQTTTPITADFAADYIDVDVPAYIAAHQLEHSRASC